ncbi:MAG TPA: hypothetical protein VFI27_15820 [candidate division Zixibacteria bacterium]|nr:hypothetical protein [candidate division Zixibacteria bacterium]
MACLSKEQAIKLKEEMAVKRDKALAEYNRCVGAMRMLDLVDGSIDIVEEADTPGEEDEKPDGEASRG